MSFLIKKLRLMGEKLHHLFLYKLIELAVGNLAISIGISRPLKAHQQIIGESSMRVAVHGLDSTLLHDKGLDVFGLL